MHVYACLDDMWKEALQGVQRQRAVPSRNGSMREMEGYCARLYDADAPLTWLWNQKRDASLVYACGELLWYLSGSNDDRLVHFAPQYKNFLDDGVAYGAYGERWSSANQLGNALSALNTDGGNSRQIVMTCWEALDLDACVQLDPPKDLPCTLSLQFLKRALPTPQLNLIVTMRSNDIWLGMPYDIFCFRGLQRMIAANLGLQTGWYQHQVGSLHLYAKNEGRAQDAAHHIVGVPPAIDLQNVQGDLSQAIWSSYRVEEKARHVGLTEAIAALAVMQPRTFSAMLAGIALLQHVPTREAAEGEIGLWHSQIDPVLVSLGFDARSRNMSPSTWRR